MPASTTITATLSGTYFLEDDGIPGNNFSRVRFPDGSVIVFEHPTNDFNFIAAVPGVNLVINLTDSLGTANVNVGDLTNAAASPDSISIGNIATSGAVTLVSNGAIVESGIDAAADIRAGSLVLSAQTGVGTIANALETQTGTLEAETDTGGINLGNLGPVVIGGLTDQVSGLDVITSGDINFTNLGTIVLSDTSGVASVDGGNTSGNVSLTANGIDADIIANVDLTSVRAARGNVDLHAGRDIAFGTIGTNFNNDVLANGNLNVTAGRDLIVDGFADLSSDSFGLSTGGDVVVNVGRDINIIAVAGTSASIFASGIAGGNVILNTGPDGTLNFSSPQPDGLLSNSGDIVINADRILIDAAADMRTFGDGEIVIHARTAGRGINLGSAGDASFAVELSNTELGRLFTNNLTIGDGNAGPVTVSAPVSFTNAPNVVLQSGIDILIQASLTVTTSLSLRGGDNVLQTSASTITAPTLVVLADQSGDDGNSGGFVNLNGVVAATTATLSGNAEADTLIGSGIAETINGNAGNDTLRGNGGNDTLIGGAGADVMDGGLGDDRMYVDSNADKVNEAAGEGTDIVLSAVSYTLAEGTFVEALATTNNAGTGAINLTGNSFDNSMSGNAGANILNGGGGADVMQGFGGNDRYYVDNALDRAVEASGGGTDILLASVSYVLGDGVFVEAFATTDNAGTAAINLTGNNLDNSMSGNAGANILDGGAGKDTMQGLGGNDVYIFDNALDRAVEAAGGGTDEIRTALASFSLATIAQVENLTGLSNAGQTLTGNSLANLITGANGNDILNGGAGADTMAGGLGNDRYSVDSALDQVIEAGGAGSDLLLASVNYVLADGISIESFATTDNAGTTAINLTGNNLVNSMSGNAGANVLDGGAGADTMQGLGGNDTYFIDDALDRVIEVTGGGTDILLSSVSYTITDAVFVESLATTNNAATTAINLTGNVLDNNITGNAGANALTGNGGNDSLVGLGGADTLQGGLGNDSLFGGLGADNLTGGAGADLFRFDSALGGGNVDTITDFAVVDDTMLLENAVFTGLAAGALAPGAFTTGSAAADASDRIIYNSATGALLFDSDGVGGVAAVQFATLQTGLALTAGDFVVI